ncbi:MAG: Imm32 family immunity protein [Armatimonadota bacterium]
MITLEFNKDKAMIELICDNDGIKSIINQLNILMKYGGHLHLMTPSWGGDDLAETPIGCGNEIINHLKIVLLSSEKSNS